MPSREDIKKIIRKSMEIAGIKGWFIDGKK
jgi:hypothetical protein